MAIALLLFAICPLVVLSGVTYFQYRNSLETARLEQLGQVASCKTDALTSLIAAYKADISGVREHHIVRYNLPALVRSPSGPAATLLRRTMDPQLRQRQAASGLSDIMLVSPSGEIVYESEPSRGRVGRAPGAEWRKAFLKGKDGVFLSDIIAEGGRSLMLLTAPVSDLDGRFAGVLCFEIDMLSVYDTLRAGAGMGKSGETLVGKRTGGHVVFLTPLKYGEGPGIPRRMPIGGALGGPVQEAAQGRSGSGRMTDYRGEDVIAAWRHIPGLNWGLVAKMDAAEAFADANRLGAVTLALIAAVLLLGGFGVSYIDRSVTRPIERLARGAHAIGAGNLDYKIGAAGEDELGRLSLAFDKMADDLKKIAASRDELDKEVSERRSAEASLRDSEMRMQRAQEMAHLGSWELDVAGNRFTWSDETYDILGLKPREVKASYDAFFAAVHPDDRAAVDAAYVGSLRAGKDSYEIEHRIVRKKTGEVRVVHQKCMHVRDEAGRILRTHGMVHDITERKKAEDALKTANKNLEDFAYVASHDLQEPLRTMSGFAELLRRRYGGRLDKEADEFLGYIVDGAQRLQTLISDLLAYSRAGRFDAPAAAVDCNAVLARVVRNLGPAVNKCGAEITSGRLPVLEGRETSFFQLFQNLIGNAIKFRGQEASRVHVDAAKQDGEWLFSVRDNGIGIDPQYGELIFQMFKRLHTREEYPGTGIGLPICKKIVEACSGRIWVESEKGKGSVFYFTIPVKESEQ